MFMQVVDLLVAIMGALGVLLAPFLLLQWTQAEANKSADFIVCALMSRIGLSGIHRFWLSSPNAKAIAQRLRVLVIDSAGTSDQNFFNAARLILTQQYLMAHFEHRFLAAMPELEKLAIRPSRLTRLAGLLSRLSSLLPKRWAQ